jgi:hypothetical protein
MFQKLLPICVARRCNASRVESLTPVAASSDEPPHVFAGHASQQAIVTGACTPTRGHKVGPHALPLLQTLSFAVEAPIIKKPRTYASWRGGERGLPAKAASLALQFAFLQILSKNWTVLAL